MSRARPNWWASIQRRLLEPTLQRAKLQKSQAALHALVTATLQSAGPPREMRRSMSQVLEAKLVTVKEPVLGRHRQYPLRGAAGIRLCCGWKRRRREPVPSFGLGRVLVGLGRCW